jgi:uncharacterized radical SAM superfamily protein
MLNMNPLGDNGVMLLGKGQVIVVVAITLFIQIKKRVPERTLLKYRFYVGLIKPTSCLHQVSNFNTTIVVVHIRS